MTSHDGMIGRRRDHDHVDAVIRWALREDLAGAAPPTRTWERIRERLEEEPQRAGGELWLALRVACGAAALWVLDAAVEPPTAGGHGGHRRLRCGHEEAYLSLLMCPHDLSMLLGQLV